jgi:predicted type IV restriction endonuclease
MTLEATLTDIAARLRQGRFPNEQAMSQGIVLRLLQELGWDTWTLPLFGLNFRLVKGGLILPCAIRQRNQPSSSK